MNSLPLYIYTALHHPRAAGHHPRLRRGQRAADDGAGAVRRRPALLVRDKGVADEGPRRMPVLCRRSRSSAWSLPSVLARRAGTAAGAVPPRHALIEGSGSSWAENAVNQWVADVHSQGIQVVYTPDGDCPGPPGLRQQDVGLRRDLRRLPGRRPGHRRDRHLAGPALRLPAHRRRRDLVPVPDPVRRPAGARTCGCPGETLAKIFTNQITNWDDPAITEDNNGHALPVAARSPRWCSRRGPGATEQLTSYFATEFPSIWKSFSGVSRPRPSTSPARGTRSPRTAPTGP